MGIVESVADELDGLIDRTDGIAAANLVHCPTIVAVLAHGDFEQAFLVLDGIRRRNDSRDVAAAFAHIRGFGWKSTTATTPVRFRAGPSGPTPNVSSR